MSKSRISKTFKKARVIFLALFVVLLFVSCSHETLPLCRVNLEASNTSRELYAIIGSTDISGDFDIYYKSMYKGTGSSYGNMSDTDPYIPLPSSGILLSQGLWEIKVILANKVDNPDSTISVSDSSNYPNGSSGDIFINLNTSTIRVAIGVGEGTGSLNFTYTIRNLSDHNLDVSVYKFDTQKNSFPTDPTATLPLVHPKEEGIVESNKYITYSPLSLGTGIYYATVTVNNSANTSTFFTDSIGFVIRNGVTTRLEGKYHKNETTGNEFNVSSGTNTGTTNTVDIKEWGGNEFSDGGIYTITESNGEYQFVCSEPTNRNKVLEDKNIVINLNGNKLFNVLIKSNNTTKTKTYFTIASGSSLSVINKSGTGNDSIYGFNKNSFKNNDKFLAGITKPDFIVDSGTLTIGSTDSNGHITVTGCPVYIPVVDTTNDYRHAAIDITPRGGNVNLIGGSSGVTINETVRGISTIIKTTNSYAVTNEFNVNINMSNASILTSG